MKVIKMVNQNFNDIHKNFRSRVREFLINCGLCWYGVEKYSGYGVLKDALAVLETTGFIVIKSLLNFYDYR